MSEIEEHGEEEEERGAGGVEGGDDMDEGEAGDRPMTRAGGKQLSWRRG